MQIVLVDWLITKGKEDEFKAYWRASLPIDDRSKMVGEFLSEPTGNNQYPWITWDLRVAGDVTRFINVGLWESADAFHEQVGRYFDPAKLKQLPFEAQLRMRALLVPRCWRMGDWRLPIHDSGGVL